MGQSEGQNRQVEGEPHAGVRIYGRHNGQPEGVHYLKLGKENGRG